MKNWLVKRLTPAKRQEDRWADFARAMEQVWEEYFDPEISRLERLRSSYTADDRDLARQIRLMGDYFSYELPKEEDKPIALAWRRLEIDYKDMELILRSAFRRHFGDFKAEWFPLFAPKDRPYGSEFVVGKYLHRVEDKNVPPEGYFLTSRGIVGVNKYDLYRDGMDKSVFRREAVPLVTRIKPLHIVFEGFLWFMRHDLGTFRLFFDASWQTARKHELLFGPLGTRFDFTPADERRLDIDIFETWRETEWYVEFPFLGFDGHIWRLDDFLPDGFGDIVPIDVLSTLASEQPTCDPFRLIYREVLQQFPLTMPGIVVRAPMHTTWNAGVMAVTPFTLSTPKWGAEQRYVLPFIVPQALDAFLPDGFGDVIPIDVLRHYARGERLHTNPLDVVYREQTQRFDIRFLGSWRYPYLPLQGLDAFLPDGFGDKIPLDVLCNKFLWDDSPIRIVYRDKEQFAPVAVPDVTGQIAQQGEQTFALTFAGGQLSRLDNFLPDGFADLIPIDLLRHHPYVERAIPESITLVYSEGHKTWNIEFLPKERGLDRFLPDVFGDKVSIDTLADGGKGDIQPFTTLVRQNEARPQGEVASGKLSVAERKTTLEPQTIQAFRCDEQPLDQLPCFDEISADFAPLDYPYGGYV